MNLSTQIEFVKSNSDSYFRFGIAAQLINLFPVVNLIGMFTNYVGAALWIADMEKGAFYLDERYSSKFGEISRASSPQSVL